MTASIFACCTDVRFLTSVSVSRLENKPVMRELVLKMEFEPDELPDDGAEFIVDIISTPAVANQLYFFLSVFPP